jgi:hypothetical protein
VEHAFAAALETLGALASQPMPAYQESTVWQHMKTTLVLAKFEPTRARIRTNLEGEPYAVNMNATEMMLHETVHPANFLLSSAILNYYFYVGLYAAVDNYSRALGDWTNAFRTTADELAPLATEYARAAFISLATGKEVQTCMSPACHTVYELDEMAAHTTIDPTVVYEPGYPTTLVLTGVHPYVSGAMVLGTLSPPTCATKHLEATYEFEIDEYGTTTPAGLLLAASTYRLFGHSVDAVCERTNKPIVTHATDRECVINPAPILNETRITDSVSLESSKPRASKYNTLPEAHVMRNLNKVTVTIMKPYLEPVEWQQRTRPLTTTLVLPTRRNALQFKVLARHGIRPMTMRVKKIETRDEPVFQGATIHIQPEKPSAGGVLHDAARQTGGIANTALAETAADSTSAEGVE